MEKEAEKTQEYLSNTMVEYFEKLELPVIKIPGWLQEELKSVIYMRLEQIKVGKLRRNDMCPAFIHYFKTVKPAFCDNRMRPIWDVIYNISPNLAVDFAQELFMIENQFEGVVGLHYKHRNELESYQKIIKRAESFYESLEEYLNYYGHMLQDEHHQFMEMLPKFIENSIESFEYFKNYLEQEQFKENDYWPITRQFKAENALAIFFLKKITIFFKKEINKPMYDHAAEITNIIFGTNYTANEAVKHSSRIKISSENPS